MEKKYDIFISYSRKDYLKDDAKTPDPDKIVSKIVNVLDANDISYWIDKEGLYSSVQFAAVIEEQISAARCFLFVSTQASNASKYTIGEVFTAVEYEKPIIPFRADESPFGKGIGFHLRPLDHIEYFKTGEEAFAKLVASVNHIKAEQLYDQLVAEYKGIVAEYKEKLRAKSDEMRRLGINPPAEGLTDDRAIERIKREYELKIANYQDEISKLEREVSELTAAHAVEIERLNNVLSERRQEVVSLKQSLSDTTSTLDKMKRELQAYKDAEARRKAEEEKKRDIIKVGSVEFKMIHVEGGTFTMGEGRDAHQVTLSSYYIGETPVTQALWKEVMGKTPSRSKGDQRPVEQVSWNDCQDFIKKLNARTGKKFRLLTEAEWEFASRGGNKSNHTQYSGSNNLDEVAWYNKNSHSETHIVKTKTPNELGIYDMSGNVWEWCQDWYGDYKKSPQTNPTGPSSGSYRVIRGGCWGSDARYCRLSLRGVNSPGITDYALGFRLALSE